MTRWVIVAAGACVALAGSGALVAVLALGLATLPVFRLPAPSGPFRVGTLPLTVDGRWALQAWYPAQEAPGESRARYDARPPVASLHRRLIGALVGTDAFVAAQPAPGRFPVILYLPGWGGLRSDNTALAQSLASHGFVVLGMDDSMPAPPMDFSSAQAYAHTRAWADEKVALQANSAKELLEALRSGRGDWSTVALNQALDLEHVGAFGFSFGGAVAAQLARVDPQVAAAADMDGWLFGAAARAGVDRPFLIASSTVERRPRSHDPAALAEFRFTRLLDEADDGDIERSFTRFGGYFLRIDGTDHNNFADAGLLPSLRRTGLGPADGRRVGRILDAYVVQFFGRYLRAQPAPLFEHPGSALDTIAVLRAWPVLGAKRAVVSE